MIIEDNVAQFIPNLFCEHFTESFCLNVLLHQIHHLLVSSNGHLLLDQKRNSCDDYCIEK